MGMVAAGVVAVLLAAAAGGAAGDGEAEGTSFDGRVEPGGVEVYGERATGGVSGGERPGPGVVTTPGGAASPGGAVVAHQRWVYACPGNGWSGPAVVDVSCEAAVQPCEAREERLVERWVATSEAGSGPPPPGPAWLRSPASRRCAPARATPATAAPPLARRADGLPVVTERDLARLALPRPRAKVLTSPAGTVLVRAPTVVHAAGGSTVRHFVMLGRPVTIRATPVSFSWDFGDGTPPQVTRESGGPWPRHATDHRYTLPGRYEVTVAVTWRGDYALAGGPWQAVPGQATVAGPATPVTVVEARSRLVG